MADAQFFQEDGEVVVTEATADARLIQEDVEVSLHNALADARLSQQFVEVLVIAPSQFYKALVTFN